MADKKYIRVQASLPPLYKRLTEAQAEYTGQSESSIVTDAVKEKFDRMSIQEREHILRMAKK